MLEGVVRNDAARCQNTAANCQNVPAIGVKQRKGFPWYLLLDGNSEIGAHVRSNLCYLTC